MKTKFLFFLLLVAATQMKANNMLVKNVTTTGDNAANKTIQVQFDMSWNNSWRDAINWDAAWVFMKYKDANGNWQHVQLNTTGFANGTGTANTIQVGSDKVGAFVYRSAAGTGTFASTTMQLQWNYGLSGLTSVTGLEIRVFAVEMVYVPAGDFAVSSEYVVNLRRWDPIYDPVNYNYPLCCGDYVESDIYIYLGPNKTIINSRLSPTISYYVTDPNYLYNYVRIKGNSGIDTNNDGIVDNTNYPTGFSSFYCYKYEMSEQQYADFLNTLTASQIRGLRIGGSNITFLNGQYNTSTPNKKYDGFAGSDYIWDGMLEQDYVNNLNYGDPTQIARLGVSGSNIFISNGQYFTSTPNKACDKGNIYRMLTYADWSGLRPMTILEFNKANNGPLMPISQISYFYYNTPNINNVGLAATSTSTRVQSGGSYYGIMDFNGNVFEPCVNLNYNSFTAANGNGEIGPNGESDVINWDFKDYNLVNDPSITFTPMILFINMIKNNNYSGSKIYPTNNGFRYVRSAE